MTVSESSPHPGIASEDPPWGAFPPWSSAGLWRQANMALTHLMARHTGGPDPARETARAIESRLLSLFPLLDALCQETCRYCPEPCCLGAKVWVDFKDLLFLHLTGQPLPMGQLIVHRHDTCACIGHRGCTLPRLSRPWICTWYLCPAQAARLRRRATAEQAFFHDTVRAVKSLRVQMEDAFIAQSS